MPPSAEERRGIRLSGHRSDILFTIAVLLLLAFAWIAKDILLLIYVSALFAVVLSPAIEAIRRVHIGHWWPGRGLAIVILLVAFFGAVVLFAAFAVPPIFRDLQNFAADVPRKVAGLYERLQRIPLLRTIDPSVLEQHAAKAVGGAIGIVGGLAGSVFALFSWIILTSYFILDGHRAFYWFLSFFPDEQRERLRSTMLRAEGRIRHWLIGQAGLMLILGCSSGLTFWALHLKYFYALGVIAGLLNIVPILGPLTSFLLASTVAAFDSWTKLLGVAIFYFAYQQIENAFLTPRIMKFSVDLPPLAVIIALALGGTLAGVVGALVAVPTAAVVAVILDEYLIRFRPHTTGESLERPEPAVRH